jgi:hypothetical protein
MPRLGRGTPTEGHGGDSSTDRMGTPGFRVPLAGRQLHAMNAGRNRRLSLCEGDGDWRYPWICPQARRAERVHAHSYLPHSENGGFNG